MFWATKSIFTRTETSQNGVFNNYEPKRARVETGKKLIANYILFNTTIKQRAGIIFLICSYLLINILSLIPIYHYQALSIVYDCILLKITQCRYVQFSEPSTVCKC